MNADKEGDWFVGELTHGQFSRMVSVCYVHVSLAPCPKHAARSEIRCNGPFQHLISTQQSCDKLAADTKNVTDPDSPFLMRCSEAWK